ncbi:MAG TPA: TIM barrel protein [Bryobacteraceae bacterium]|nr:TIM barrel protein [Bryobacteraceae bacterium]
MSTNEISPPLTELGIASTSFMGDVLGQRSTPSKASSNVRSVMSLPPVPQGRDTVHFLERCHTFGAAGIQSQIAGDPHALRARAEELGMWVEAMISVRNNSPESLEREIINAKQAGCTVARDGLLGGRRYETFNSLPDWHAWVEQSTAKLETAIPIFEKHKLALAIENHKDWTTEQYLQLFKSYSSEYFGACLDLGNSISLLDGLMETIEQAAPYVKTTHFKDVAVAPYADGFLLAEVPLGTGVIDLPHSLDVLRRAQPDVRLVLEMITRDPLKIPCLTDHYWLTLPDRNGLYLARTLRFVEEHKTSEPLPHPEELTEAERTKVESDNICACFRYMRRRVV